MSEYPQLYHAHHRLRAADVPFWEALARESGGPILELGCGTGRVAAALAGLGYPVTGLDNDPDMLAFLTATFPPQQYPALRVVEADMTDFDLAARFALIILPCNTYSTFSSLSRLVILRAVLRHLAPDGVFAFSIPNPDLLAGLPRQGPLEFEDEFPHPATGHPVQVFTSWLREPGSITFFWRYDHLHPDGSVFSTAVSTTHILDHGDVYLAELQASGLRPRAVYGGFDRAPFTPQSNYMIVLATRSGAE